MRIFANTSFEGVHSYPDAPAEVSFLRYPHRHIFHVYVEIDVFHDDREIEFVMFKNFIDRILNHGEQDHKSCEMIIKELAEKIKEKYPGRTFMVRVSEDGENGALENF